MILKGEESERVCLREVMLTVVRATPKDVEFDQWYQEIMGNMEITLKG